MKTNKMKIWIGCGIICVLSVLLSSWYAVTFNDSRLIVPMDFKNYVFEIRDLPMIVSVSLTCIYLAMLFVVLFIHTGKKQRQAEETGVTRKINPRLGRLGVLGFLGFAGFWTYSVNGIVFPFAFFLFFGFFGFYYEGKMSGTFMDERFRENIACAKLKAYRITFGIMLIALVILCQGKLFGSLEYTLIAAIITLSLALALGIFLSEYLLYRYDHDDQAEEGGE
ncbi:hypothetical protein C805_03624 [Eubacterium sp. 14-2]|uniref:DUF3796 domain-containing protein n=1 Tax=Eubacterium sp. 14-2 TaxID=1235790 RepID=UPI00033739DE|nr:DUF3796 domain-containing protein [Eubacterium sp. 14-2]EOT21546.1 hypothetical protein C805_03624 [Eubacterium sp. 14-2]